MSSVLPHVVEGDGPPLLLVNGGAMTWAAWEPVAAPLREAHRVVSCDLRGQLRHPVPPPPRLEDHAEDLIALLDTLCLSRVQVAGTSYGAFVAMALASAHPERVESLALITAAEQVSTRMVEDCHQLEQLCERAAAGDREASLQVFDLLIGEAYSPEWKSRNASLLESRRAGLPALCPMWYTGLSGLLSGLARFSPRAHLERIRLPTLVVGAEADSVFPIIHSRALAAAIPAARLEIVPKSGHALVVEAPSALASLLRDFFRPTGRGAES